MTSPDRDRGFTLIELLVAITLMAVAFGAVFGGLGLFFKIESTQKSNSAIDVQLRNYADRVLDLTYAPCATPASYAAATVPAGYTGSMTVQYWDGKLAPQAGFGTTCASDKGVQQITLTLSDASGVSGTLVIGKSS